eukprot:TRINITY_DN6693_c0_g1_i4.p1 TRINITY_DN6693_c0_g1~~TRINITY_DN6693_c0_g1_i4.p1  ORF type:complete len:460 (+),score=99.56 TRINITY_DN6693_c0_g1_i4:65-1444(+)
MESLEESIVEVDDEKFVTDDMRALRSDCVQLEVELVLGEEELGRLSIIDTAWQSLFEKSSHFGAKSAELLDCACANKFEVLLKTEVELEESGRCALLHGSLEEEFCMAEERLEFVNKLSSAQKEELKNLKSSCVEACSREKEQLLRNAAKLAASNDQISSIQSVLAVCLSKNKEQEAHVEYLQEQSNEMALSQVAKLHEDTRQANEVAARLKEAEKGLDQLQREKQESSDRVKILNEQRSVMLEETTSVQSALKCLQEDEQECQQCYCRWKKSFDDELEEARIQLSAVQQESKVVELDLQQTCVDMKNEEESFSEEWNRLQCELNELMLLEKKMLEAKEIAEEIKQLKSTNRMLSAHLCKTTQKYNQACHSIVCVFFEPHVNCIYHKLAKQKYAVPKHYTLSHCKEFVRNRLGLGDSDPLYLCVDSDTPVTHQQTLSVVSKNSKLKNGMLKVVYSHICH